MCSQPMRATAVIQKGMRGQTLTRSLLVVAVAFGAACGPQGEGALDGTFFLRGCPDRDPTQSATAVPSPLPPFSLAPTFFVAERWDRIEDSPFTPSDPRRIAVMQIRLQRTSHKPYFTDYLQLQIGNLDTLAQVQDAALARGEPGVPIVPPALSGNSVPLPGDPEPNVRASLSLNATCWFPRVAPLVRGHVRFSAFGRKPGEELAGTLSLSLWDARAEREQGPQTPLVDVAGQLSGYFRFVVEDGPTVPNL